MLEDVVLPDAVDVLARRLVVKGPEAVNRIVLETTTEFVPKVVKDAIVHEFTGKVELPFIAGSVLEVKMTVGLIIEGVGLFELSRELVS